VLHFVELKTQLPTAGARGAGEERFYRDDIHYFRSLPEIVCRHCAGAMPPFLCLLLVLERMTWHTHDHIKIKLGQLVQSHGYEIFQRPPSVLAVLRS
jgi:hypothetical protein